MEQLDWINRVETPFLLIEESRLIHNVNRLYNHVEKLGSTVRPHLKTLRSSEAARNLLRNFSSPATVSTLAEAEGFAKAGYTDLLYAVGIAPHKLPRIAKLMQRGVRLHMLLDTVEQAKVVTAYGKSQNICFSVFIEVDCDGHRGGITPDSDELLQLAKQIDGNGAVVTGLLTHAGESYSCRTKESLKIAAKRERQAIIMAGQRVRALGVTCPILSIGSTPTAHFTEDLSGVSEVRAGVFSTFDLVMKNIGVCNLDDIAISVVTTIIGYNLEKRSILIDAGWMALSRDRGTAAGPIDYQYGQVCDLQGRSYPNLYVSATNQEHGIIVLPSISGVTMKCFSIGTRLRILPNHACATAAMHQHYEVLKKDGLGHETWHRIIGW